MSTVSTQADDAVTVVRAPEDVAPDDVIPEDVAGLPSAVEVTRSIARRIAEDLGVREQQVGAAVGLLDGGATVPFVARYRKEVTEGLDDAQLRSLEEALGVELHEAGVVVLDVLEIRGGVRDGDLEGRRARVDRGRRRARGLDAFRLGSLDGLLDALH